MQLSESLFPCFNLHCQTPMILWFYWWRLTWGVRRSRSEQLRTSHQLWLLALTWHSELSFWYFFAFKTLTLCIHWITQRIPVLTNLSTGSHTWKPSIVQMAMKHAGRLPDPWQSFREGWMSILARPKAHQPTEGPGKGCLQSWGRGKRSTDRTTKFTRNSELNSPTLKMWIHNNWISQAGWKGEAMYFVFEKHTKVA